MGNAALKQTALLLFAKCNRGATATEKKIFCVLWSFLISSVIENLNPASLQQTADLFPEHVPQRSFRLFFQCRILTRRYEIRAVYDCAGGLDILKFDKNSPYLWCFIFQFGGRGALFWGLSPPKSSRRNGTASMSSWNRVLKIVEYSPSCSSMEYCYSSFSLRQEFFISLGQNIVFWTPWLTFLWQY